MSSLVHYLIRHPIQANGLIYPSELSDDSYVGFGSFFLLGLPWEPLVEAYTFHAIQGEQVIETTLLPIRNSRSFFRAEVSEIGAFIFYAQPVANSPTYIGTDTVAYGLTARRRLRSWRPDDLDRACREHEFYFVGRSPRTDGESQGWPMRS